MEKHNVWSWGMEKNDGLSWGIGSMIDGVG